MNKSEPIYKALLIGNSKFPLDPHNLPELNGPPNDLKILRETISDSQVGLHKRSNVKTILNKKKDVIIKKMGDFFNEAENKDQILLYYSGHGSTDILGNFYLCAKDTTTDRLPSRGISDLLINRIIENSKCNRILIILDCCQSGRYKWKGFGDYDNLKGSGRVFIASCQSGKPSMDSSSENEPSAFTKIFCDALKTQEVDVNQDGKISIDEIFKYVSKVLKEKTKQIVQGDFSDITGELFIGKNIIVKPIKPRKKDLSEKGDPVLYVSQELIELKNVKIGEILPPETIFVSNKGKGKLDWTVECNNNWTKIKKYDDRIELQFEPKLGINRGSIYIRDKGKGGSKTIRLIVYVQEHTEAEIERFNELKSKIEDVETWINNGISLGDVGRYDEALECFDNALRINPDNADAWANKGAVFGMLGRHIKAIKCLNKTLKINPHYGEAWNNKGAVLEKLKRYNEALKCHNRALELNPDYAGAWYNKGVVLGKLERYDEELKSYDKAIELNPEYANAWHNKGVALKKLKRKKDAKECFKNAKKYGF